MSTSRQGAAFTEANPPQDWMANAFSGRPKQSFILQVLKLML